MQMDVIEAQYSQLGEALSKAQDFKEAQRAHESFLTALMDTSLLDMPMFVSHLTCAPVLRDALRASLELSFPVDFILFLRFYTSVGRHR
jgi:hypothetical protein